jgi:hypothetical protein
MERHRDCVGYSAPGVDWALGSKWSPGWVRGSPESEMRQEDVTMSNGNGTQGMLGKHFTTEVHLQPLNGVLNRINKNHFNVSIAFYILRKHLCTYKLWEVRTITISILLLKNLRPREGNSFSQSHTASKWQS